MRIQVRPTLIERTPELSRPAPPALPGPAKSPYQVGTNVDRLRKFGGTLTTPRTSDVGAASATLNRKAISEAKELVRRAESLLGSHRAGDRSEAYELLRQAGEKLSRVDTRLGAEFVSLSEAFYANDERARVFEGLLQWQFDRDSAEKAAQTADCKEPDPWRNLENVLALSRLTEELNRL